MLLCVDVGNSHTVSGVFENDELVSQWRLKSDRDRTADELAIRYHSLFQMAAIDITKITGFIIASVVPTLETSWLAYANKYFGKQLLSHPVAVSHSTRTGIIVKTDNPAEVGADRIVNAVAAWEQFKNNLIVIDFGTAITFDCVTRQKEYIGGAIMPGIAISLDALATRTAKLPRIDIDKAPKSVIGTTTVSAMRSGILYGFGGMVDRMVEKIIPELSPQDKNVNIIATGGMAALISPYSEVIEAVDPLLTLKGLKIIHKK
jgi:type III pantothenate kinase